MNKLKTVQVFTLGLVLVSGAADAGLFSKKKPAPPPAPEPAPVVVPVAPPPPPPPPIPLEYSGIQTALPVNAPLFRLQSASAEVQATANWVAASKDNKGLPFIVVDKVNAQIYSFTPFAQLKATAPVLLGMGKGDVALVPQDAPMSAMPPDKRITPAGRYQSYLVRDNHNKVVLLVDGPNLITIHPVAKGTPAQRRAERLASVTSGDNRISFGCINVPPAFFANVVDPDFRPRQGIVYVLPEKTTAAQLFGFQPPTTGAVGLQTALTANEAPAAAPSQAAATFQAAVNPGAAPAPLQTSLTPAVSSAPLQTSLTPAVAPAPIQASVTPSAAPQLLELPQTTPATPADATPDAAPVAQ